MVALMDTSTLSTLIVGHVVESADIQRQAIIHREFVLQQVKQNASFDSVSKEVHSKVRQANVQLNKFDVEDVYHRSSVGQANANLWFNARCIDKQTKNQIKPVC